AARDRTSRNRRLGRRAAGVSVRVRSKGSSVFAAAAARSQRPDSGDSLRQPAGAIGVWRRARSLGVVRRAERAFGICDRARAARAAHFPAGRPAVRTYDGPSMSAGELLSELIGFDTRNPGGDEAALAASLYEKLRALEADEVDLVRVGSHAYVAARYGTPRLLVNAHLDTVPTGAGWSRPPLQPHLENGRLYGLGPADTKGPPAATRAALAEVNPKGTLVLFSGDEEHGGSCMRAFLASGRAQGIERAVVCEPTSLRVGTRHRGVMAFSAEVTGEGGHSSRADQLPRPIARLARIAVALDDWGQKMLPIGPPGFAGMWRKRAGT